MTVLSVAQLNRYVKSLLESDPLLGEVYVRGEISSLNIHSATGHMYFALKDGTSSVRAVMWRGNASRLRFSAQNGLSVIVRGQATLYERDGSYQISVTDMQLDGVGAMYAAFDKLKLKLEAEGLFSPERKKLLPQFPKRIGVVTSKSGAALQDIINVLSRRYPLGRLIISPAFVQGDQAAPSLISAIRALDSGDNCDVIIIARGGGSMEDLWSFNEEKLVRAVADCKTPTISAIGHETDFTLCDFAADVRAPTPSAAAEISAPDLSGLSLSLTAMKTQMSSLMIKMLFARREELKRLSARTLSRDASMLLLPYRKNADMLSGTLERLYSSKLENWRNKIAMNAALLDMGSPLKTISRGYTITTDRNGRLTQPNSPPREGDMLTTRFFWGETQSTVNKTEVYANEKTEL